MNQTRKIIVNNVTQTSKSKYCYVFSYLWILAFKHSAGKPGHSWSTPQRGTPVIGPCPHAIVSVNLVV